MTEILKVLTNIISTTKVNDIAEDCARVFNAKAIDAKNENYSTGTTYFIRASEKPKNALEKLAKEIFNRHTTGLVFDPKESGAEWWSQVIHPEDDIGIHWDRDYGLEEEFGQHVYPNYGTVTYLSDIGAPTVVFNKPGTELATEEIIGSISEMAVSCPSIGNHIVFDGTLLHAAPADVFIHDPNGDDDDDDEESEEDSDGEESLSELLKKLPNKRISFLVNIWLNHVPSQSIKCPEKINKKLQCTLADDEIHLSGDYVIPEKVALEQDDIVRKIDLKFNNSDTNYDVEIHLPTLDVLNKQKNKPFLLAFPENAPITIAYSENQSDSESGSGDDDEDSDDDDENSGSDEDGDVEDLEEDSEESEEVVEVKKASKRKLESSSSSSSQNKKK